MCIHARQWSVRCNYSGLPFQIYELLVVDTKPDKAVSIIECDMKVHFSAWDYISSCSACRWILHLLLVTNTQILHTPWKLKSQIHQKRLATSNTTCCYAVFVEWKRCCYQGSHRKKWKFHGWLQCALKFHLDKSVLIYRHFLEKASDWTAS